MKYTPETYLPNHPITISYENKGSEYHEVYQINPTHRNGNRNKSQWTISQKEEVHVFGWALEQDSTDANYYWGVFLNGPACGVLGKTTDNKDSKIARFEGSRAPRIWHGYPVDYYRDPHDHPGRTLLLGWVSKGLITKQQVSKLVSGRGWKD